MSISKPERVEPFPPAAASPATTIARPVDGSLLSIMRFAEAMANAMQDFYNSIDSTHVDDFEAMGQDIASVRGEVTRLRADDLAGSMLPAVAEILDGLRGVMSGSAEQILHHAEAGLDADWREGESYAAEINMRLMRIIEACAFQDLTGQRLERAQDLLSDLQNRMERFASSVGTEETDDKRAAETSLRDRRRAALMLHGPQNGRNAIGQDEIDRIFGDAAE